MKITGMGSDSVPLDVLSSMPDNGCGKEWAGYLRVDYGDGGDVAYYSDAMEPEDASFGRDLDWIKVALERAYRAGQAGK